jgi:D-arginine dehydrogenase
LTDAEPPGTFVCPSAQTRSNNEVRQLRQLSSGLKRVFQVKAHRVANSGDSHFGRNPTPWEHLASTQALRGMPDQHVAILGAGIAGLSVAYGLARRNFQNIDIFEREHVAALHSSGKNAAIWLPTEIDDDAPALTRRSVEILNHLLPNDAWIRRTGAYKIAEDPEYLTSHRTGALASGCSVRSLNGSSLRAEIPVLNDGRAQAAIYVAEAGILDIAAMIHALLSVNRKLGVVVRFNHQVKRLRREALAATGAQYWLESNGDSFGPYSWIVDAGGAWAGRLLREVNVERPIFPMRRHLMQIQPRNDNVPQIPAIVWSADDEFYVRPESGGLLASPCEEVMVDADHAPIDPLALDLLAAKFRHFAPELETTGLLRQWTCLRSFSSTRTMVIGPIDEKAGIAMLAGLGGRGMTVGIGAGDRCAQLMADACERARAASKFGS